MLENSNAELNKSVNATLTSNLWMGALQYLVKLASLFRLVKVQCKHKPRCRIKEGDDDDEGDDKERQMILMPYPPIASSIATSI
jgi:hypothetical protein